MIFVVVFVTLSLYRSSKKYFLIAIIVIYDEAPEIHLITTNITIFITVVALSLEQKVTFISIPSWTLWGNMFSLFLFLHGNFVGNMFSLRYAYGNVIETGKTRTIMAYRLYIGTMIE